MTSTELFKQGAEGKIYVGEYNGKVCLVKERFKKKYRHPELDIQLTKERIRAESRTVSRCAAAGILTPQIFHTDLNERKIYMEYFDKAITAKDYISTNELDNEKINVLAAQIGNVIGTMHANDIIHGDLTTSNMLLNPKNNGTEEYVLIMIDFGLSRYHSNPEDKGVDLYVLERALLSTHSGLPLLFSSIMDAYKMSNKKNLEDVIAKYEEVRARGRKRTMVG